MSCCSSSSFRRRRRKVNKAFSCCSTDSSDSDINNEPINQIIERQEERDDNDDKLLLLGDELNELSEEARDVLSFSDTKIELDIPKIVVMGTQSSGKSTFLNKLIKYDVMPTGHNMVTKTPVYVRMYKVKPNSEDSDELTECAKISTYENDVLTTHKTILLTSDNYKEIFETEFEKVTNRIVGKFENISSKPIYIDVYSHKISNLTLVDLPGIIAVSKTDKGQSCTLVDDIKNMVEGEISRKNVYIVLCMEAKPDLETDIGLSTLREMKKKNDTLRAITLFTKLDLLEGDRLDRFKKMLKDGLSKDLQTDDGYFCVSAMKDDASWYRDHLDWSCDIYRNKLYGIRNFFVFLRKKMTSLMRKSFTQIKTNLDDFIARVSALNPQLEGNLKKRGDKLTFASHNIYILSRAISNSFNAIGFENNVAHDFKRIFSEYSKKIISLDPFSEQNLPDAKFIEIMKNFEGYLPSNKIVATSVINKCLKDTELKPLVQIIDASVATMNMVEKLIFNLVEKFLEMDKLDIHQQELNSFSVPVYHFPNLKEFILKTTKSLLAKYQADSLKIILDYLQVQEKQVWVGRRDMNTMYDTHSSIGRRIDEETNYNGESSSIVVDDEDTTNYNSYLEQDANARRKDDNISDFEVDPHSAQSLREMRYLSRIVFKRIASTTQHVALKTIITSIIKKIENHFFLEVIKKLNEIEDINHYFYDSDEKVRQTYKVENIVFKGMKLSEALKNHDIY